ncbi:hypothetical protein E2C01_092724 [Portunus trituberculatus]|uniref:Uncharacterized protein n=1 Tax=Portunus trituberculatus TaxID=210409 RepID=A0A5B7JRB4_PORTR|nr:hypothetical protein [Portunus trituberculatus]
MQPINMRQAHGRHARRSCKNHPVSPPPTRPKEETGPVGDGYPQIPEALPERGAAHRLNQPTPGPAKEKT